MKTGLPLMGLLAAAFGCASPSLAAVGAIEPTAARATPNRVLVGAGIAGVLDGERNAMLMVEVQGGRHYAGLHPWFGANWATDGGTFVGGGVLHTFFKERTWQATIGFGPGYYERNQGRDLGKHLEFLSFFELSHAVRRHQRLSLRLAHISNGSLGYSNPGTELLTLGYLIPLGQGH